ncbi:MAG: hypothetical protein A3F10_07490 [Coxiella sp. RIFCSPHIGHO2_12_FULL_42_15]|nr:MAG: hypothetical protein A3F10_07490 [Coxiella sp. RIFCSPHIGHO2_12_FULL_42_15]
MENVDFLSLYHTDLRQQRLRYYLFCFVIFFICIGIGLFLQRHFFLLNKKMMLQQEHLIKAITHPSPKKKNAKDRVENRLAVPISILKMIETSLPAEIYLDSLLFKSNRFSLRGQSTSFSSLQKLISLLKQRAGIQPPKTLRYDQHGKFILTTTLPYV